MQYFSTLPRLYQNFITVPSIDSDDGRRKKLLNILLAGMLGLSILSIFAIGIILLVADKSFTAHQKSDGINSIYLLIFLIVGALLFYAINRYGSGILAGSLFLIFLLIAVSFSDTPDQLAGGRSLFVFTIPVVMASLLLRPWSSFIFAGLSAIAIYFVARSANVEANLFITAGNLIIALTSWLSARSLEEALRDLRLTNANLDKIVTDRTHDLAEALGRERAELGRSQAILSSIADGVVVFNTNQSVQLANPALSQLTEISMQNLSEINLDEFTQSEKLNSADRKILLATIQNTEEPAESARVKWGQRTLSVKSSQVQDVLTHKNIGSVAVFRDVSYEAELEKMKQTFVAVVSHELRTPLNAIIGHTEILQEEIYGKLNEQQFSITERIIINTRRLLAMVSDLLDEAQMKAGKLSIQRQNIFSTSLLENMHITMDGIVTSKGLYLTHEFDPGMPETIIGDPNRLHQIIVNLINNSVKFTAQGGIHVSITRSRSDNSHWKLEITDTGAGIPEQDIPYIFETFRQVENSTTRSHGGFGLGLSIVKQLVDIMNGTIAVKSELNKGSIFTITLPFIT